MSDYCVKALLVVAISALAPVSTVFAEVKKQIKAAGRYYDDISGEVSFQEIKRQRDAETIRIREEIFTIRPALKSDREDMAKKVLDRKIKIVREKRFLDSEFEEGVDRLYKKGVTRFGSKDYSTCRIDFEEVERLHPGYKDTRDYLKKLNKVPRQAIGQGQSGDIASSKGKH